MVTVSPRSFPPIPRHRRERERILAEVGKRHRPTQHEQGKWLTLDFSRRDDPAAVRAEVVGWLDEINAHWRRYVKVYPRG